MPSLEQQRKIKSQFEIFSIPSYVVKTDDSRGARHGQSQWQYDHWKAKDAKRHAAKKNHKTILLKWQNDEKYRTSQNSCGLDRGILSFPGLYCVCCCDME